ncbi:hypothetical protein [Streptomyces sp. NBC_00690]|uniref:hypothetical protein n=1 Tax=Streptomyces sp. NBC_00690 TaxID=2975808 RepID=UPI002E29247A|nr:hypothetical protein [Streptomyces sp. NBC_00690]
MKALIAFGAARVGRHGAHGCAGGRAVAPNAVRDLSGLVLRLLRPALALLPSMLMVSARVTVVTNFSRSGDSRHTVE